MRNILRLIKRDILLFFQTPKNYIYSLLVTEHEPVKLYAYDSQSAVIAKDLQMKIRQNVKGVHVEFVGSAALKLPGYKDIDLFIPTTQDKLHEIDSKLVDLFGKPTKRRKYFSEWNIRKKNFMVELMLINKSDKAYVEQKIVYDILRKNKMLLKEYKTLKLNAQGILKNEYQKRRLEFYNRIIREHHGVSNSHYSSIINNSS
jgi:GrpB-like predicted nucleotidyltransferase (UPF0157 family)